MKKIMVAMAVAMAAAMALATGVSISYQGQLRGGKGEQISSEHPLSVNFRLYDAAMGGVPLWGRCFAVNLDTNGYFNVELYDDGGSPLSPEVKGKLEDVIATKAQSSSLFIGLEVVGSTGEIAPRQKLLSVPVAALALNAQQAKGNFTVNGTATVAGPLNANGDLTVKGALKSEGDIELSGTLKLGGGAHVTTSVGVDLVPNGVIVMWSGKADKIPKGWALCDGSQDTPDLRGRFIVGYDARNVGEYDVDKTGGEATHKLSVNEMPSHNHTYQFTGADLKAAWDSDNYFYCHENAYPNNKNTRSTDSAGGNMPHENRPPYYALCFIMKLPKAR